MQRTTPSLFEAVVLKNRHFFYLARLVAFALAGLLIKFLPLFAPRQNLIGGIFVVWILITLFFYRGIGNAEQAPALFFFQSLLDLIFLLALAHLTGGPSSPFLPAYILIALLIIWTQPAAAFNYFLALTAILYLTINEMYRWHILEALPVSHNFQHTLLANEIIWTSSFVISAWLLREWIHYYSHLWQTAEDQRNYLAHLSEISVASFQARNNDDLYHSLAVHIRAALSCQDVFIFQREKHTGSIALVGKTTNPDDTQDPSLQAHLAQLAQSEDGKIIVRDEDENIWVVLKIQMPEHIHEATYLAVVYPPQHRLAPSRIKHIYEIVHILRLVLEHKYKYATLYTRAGMLTQLSNHIIHLSNETNQEDLLASIAQATRDLLKAQRTAIYLFDSQGKLHCVYSQGLSQRYVRWLEAHYHTLPEWQNTNGMSFAAISDTMEDRRTSPQLAYLTAEHIQAYALFNLQDDIQRLGVLALYWDTPHVFSEQEMEIASIFARRAADALNQANQYARLRKHAYTDALTNIPNRYALNQRLQDEINRAQWEHYSFSFMMIDLDGFKNINDQYGHPIGDSVLQQIAQVLSNAIRSSDFLARYGGDEFSIIFPKTDLSTAYLIARKIRNIVQDSYLLLPDNTHCHPVSLSIGIAVYPDDGRTHQELMQQADQRLYQAKRSQSIKIYCGQDSAPLL